MSALMQEPTAGLEPVTGASRRGQFFWTLLKDRKAAAIGLGVLVFFVLLSIIGPYVAPYSSTAQSCGVFAPPSVHHWLGCDDGGIDMLSELMQGGRVSLMVGFAATLVSMLIGGGVGIVSGYFGGLADSLLMRCTDYLLVVPDLVLAMVIAAVWGASVFHVILVIGLLQWTTTARVIRSQVISVRDRAYVRRTRGLGASSARILIRHILPEVGPLLIANMVLTVSN